jgi:hypothetical protein
MSDDFIDDTPPDQPDFDDEPDTTDLDDRPDRLDPPHDGWDEPGPAWHGDGGPDFALDDAHRPEVAFDDDDGGDDDRGEGPKPGAEHRPPERVVLPADGHLDGEPARPLLPTVGDAPAPSEPGHPVHDVLAADAADAADAPVPRLAPGDVPDHPGGIRLDAADAPAGIEALADAEPLDLDPDAQIVGDLDADDADDPAAPLTFGEAEHTAFADVPADNGSWNPLVVAAAVAAATGVAVNTVTGRIAANRHARTHDAHGIAGLADELGVDAVVEHGNVERLRTCLRRGGTVLLENTSGADPLTLVEAGPDRIVVQPLSGGRRSTAPLATLRAAWADTAGQLVSIEGGERPIVVLPVMLPDNAFSPVPP